MLLLPFCAGIVLLYIYIYIIRASCLDCAALLLVRTWYATRRTTTATLCTAATVYCSSESVRAAAMCCGCTALPFSLSLARAGVPGDQRSQRTTGGKPVFILSLISVSPLPAWYTFVSCCTSCLVSRRFGFACVTPLRIRV